MIPFITVRAIRPEDGPAFVELRRLVVGETPFMLAEPDEDPPWADDPVTFLRDRHPATGNAFFVATDGDALVGYLWGLRGNVERSRHVGRVVVAVRQSHVGRGIGRRLMRALDGWARDSGIVRLELEVAVANPRAHALYRNEGFEDEGLKRGGVRLPDGDRDDTVMGRLLGSGLARWEPLDLDAPPAPDDAGRVEVRAIRAGDAPAWYAHQRIVRTETDFLGRTLDEAAPDLATVERAVAAILGGPDRMFVAVVPGPPGDRIVGDAGIHRPPLRRLRHVGGVGISVQRAYWRGGVGSKLLGAAEAWAAASGLERLELEVMHHNVRARRFYERRGYVVEATKRAAMRIDGRYADLILMAKRLG